MKVFCAYDSELDSFIKTVADYVLKKYGNELDLRDVHEIEIVKELDNKNSDGRFIGSRIVLAERLYRALPCFDITMLEDNDPFTGIVRTLYHEMGHATDMVRMPKMYEAVFDAFKAESVTNELMSTFLFLEFVAERRTGHIRTKEDQKYCRAVGAGSWNIYKDVAPETDLAFNYLSKVLIYFIVRTREPTLRDQYLSYDKDPLLRKYADALESVLESTYMELPFDSIERCARVADVMNNYQLLFEKKYAIK